MFPIGKTSRGVRSMKTKDDDIIADIKIISSKTSKGLCVARKYLRLETQGFVSIIAMKFNISLMEDKVSCLRVNSEDLDRVTFLIKLRK